MTPSDDIARLQTELEDKGAKYCIGAYVDIHEVQRAKVAPIHPMGYMAQGSGRYIGYAVDGLGQAPNNEEITSTPDFSHLIQLPREPKIAWIPADNHFKGKPFALNTRVALQNQRAEAAKLGFGMNLGIECENFLLKKTADSNLIPADAEDTLDKSCDDVRGFTNSFEWLDKIATAMNGLGWDLYLFDKEDANGQFEFDFQYADALTTCDRLIFFRYMAKHYAREMGLLAMMMPKPFADKTGNCAHLNISHYDLKNSADLFACDLQDDPHGIGITELGYQFTADILKQGRALCAVFDQTVNCYKRLVRRSRGIEVLPQTLQEAVSTSAADSLIEKVLGNAHLEEFTRYKTEEWELPT